MLGGGVFFLASSRHSHEYQLGSSSRRLATEFVWDRLYTVTFQG